MPVIFGILTEYKIYRLRRVEKWQFLCIKFSLFKKLYSYYLIKFIILYLITKTLYYLYYL